MATLHLPLNDNAVFERAERLGFELRTREADTGQIVWEWSHREKGPCAQFVTERVARQWMSDCVERFEQDRARHGW